MKIRSNTGGVVSIGDERAKRLLETGFWTTVDEARANDDDWQVTPAAENDAEPTEADPQGEDTEDTVQDAPALPEAPEEAPKRPAAAVVRAWAQENNVEVSPKGKVSEAVYEKYAEAHKEN